MKNHSLLYFLIFICSLVLGYSISTRFYPANLDVHPGTMRLVAAGSQNSIETMNNGQRSILLISAASISSVNPQLESVWLATYFSTDTTIRLLPIFPAGAQPISDFEQQLDQSFNVDKLNDVLVLDQDFINVLKNNNYWWSGYIIFDEVALVGIFDLMGGIDLNGETLTGEQALKELPSASDNPEVAFSLQIAMIQSACHRFQEISSNQAIAQLISRIPKHILTDLDSSQLHSEIQSLSAGDRNPTCRFPTLEFTQVVTDDQSK